MFVIGGGTQLVLGAQFGGTGRVENEVCDAAAVDHRVQIKDIGIGGMKTHERLERALIEIVAVVLRIAQTPVQVSIDDTGGHLADRSDVHSQLLPARLLR